jgi:phenylacetate-coenzyme A ligase PaaK-like adenylate-forming protein
MIPDSIFDIQTPQQFEQAAMEVFHYQYRNCDTYRQYVDATRRAVRNINQVEDIPFLPVEFFKNHKIIAHGRAAQLIFTSSGTTGNQTSVHYVADEALYQQSLRKCFEQFVGRPGQFAILALLPSYLERKNSSLVYMIEQLISQSTHPASNFYLHNTDELLDALNHLLQIRQPAILFGAAFALLDLVEKHDIPPMPDLWVFETGGMKGRRKEVTREEIHRKLAIGLGVKTVYSEYGMTELLSQAYSLDGQTFLSPPWMRICLRDPYDPFTLLTKPHHIGGINVIDLANMYSCSFIATQDLGILHQDGRFEVLGRFDYADLRGCNMLIEN